MFSRRVKSSWEQAPYRESIMKLHLISSAVVVYTALATVCICYAGV